MLDKISKKILMELQSDGRISNVELAARVNLSPAACLERVRKLHESGYIMGYTAQLNPQLLDVSLLVFIEVVLDRTTPEVFDAFKHSVQIIPEVLECHMVAGGFDYLVKARVKDMAAYREFLGKTLLQKGVRETHTYAVMEEVKIPPNCRSNEAVQHYLARLVMLIALKVGHQIDAIMTAADIARSLAINAHVTQKSLAMPSVQLKQRLQFAWKVLPDELKLTRICSALSMVAAFGCCLSRRTVPSHAAARIPGFFYRSAAQV